MRSLNKNVKRLVHSSSLREKKRYLAYKVISFEDEPINYEIIKESEEEISKTFLTLFGEVGYSKAGMIFVRDIKNINDAADQTAGQRERDMGIVKVNRKYVKHLKACLALTKWKNFSVKSKLVSGSLSTVKAA